jgi:hypothetical protein
MSKTDFTHIQTEVTTGGLTLPVALVVWLLLGLGALEGWDIAYRLAAGVATGYLLIELNTAYSLIRQRTTLHISTFLMLSAASFSLPLSVWEAWMAPLFLLSIHQLFATYESPRPQFGAFNACFCLGLGSFVFPPLAWLLPIWMIGFYQMRALTVRSFLAALIGFIAPWWCYYGLAYSFSENAFTLDRLLPLLTFHPIDYSGVAMGHWLLWGTLAAASLVSDIHYALVSYMDKVRTRLHLSYLVFLQIILYVLALVQPTAESVVCTLQIPLSALLLSHLFMLTRTRLISYYFIILFILILLLPVLVLWIV